MIVKSRFQRFRNWCFEFLKSNTLKVGKLDSQPIQNSQYMMSWEWESPINNLTNWTFKGVPVRSWSVISNNGCKNSPLTVQHVYLLFLHFMNCVKSKCFCHVDIKAWNASTGQSDFIHCRSILINITWMCFHTDWYSVLSVESCSI